MRRIRVATVGISLLAAGCGAPRDPAAAPVPVAVEGRLAGGGPAAGLVAVQVFDAWNRTVLPGATVVCHETGDGGTTDAAGVAVLHVPTGPFSVTAGGVPGFGCATMWGARTAAVGCALPALAPRTVGVRGTITNLVVTTASRVEVPDQTGGLDPWLGASPSDTYQLTMRSGRNFRATALEIGTSGLASLAISPVQWKLAPHKTVTTVDFPMSLTPPVLTACSGGLLFPAGFTAASVEVRGRAVEAHQEFFPAATTVVGWGVVTGFGTTYTLDYAPSLLSVLPAQDLTLDGVARNSAGDLTRALVPHAATLAGAFPTTQALSFPALAWVSAPLAGQANVGVTPTLVWNGTVTAGSGAYRLRLADPLRGTLWDVWVDGAATSVTLPALPGALAGAGLAAGSPATVELAAFHCPATDWTDATLARLDGERTGETVAVPHPFIP